MTGNGRLRVAQIGVAEVADLQMTALVDNPHVGDVWLAEGDASARAELAGKWGIIKRAVGDWRELAGEESVDLAHLCGALGERAEVARAFLGAGKAVILEAPPAASLEDMDAMIGAAADGARLFCALPQLMHPAIVRAEKLVKEGEIGEVFSGQVTAVEGAGRAALEGAGFHAIYVLQRFLGAATEVRGEVDSGARGDARESTVDRGRGETCALSLRHGEGKVSGILVAQGDGTRAMAERWIVGTEGLLVLRDDPEWDLPMLGCRGEEVIPIPIPELLQVRPWYEARMLDHFIECLRHDKEPVVSVAEARAALATALEGKLRVASRE